MNIGDIVKGLAAGVGVALSPDEKTALYVEWSIGELCRVELDTGKVTRVLSGFDRPEDVEVDWDTGDIFVSERTGEISKLTSEGRPVVIANPGGAPQQLALVKDAGARYLFTVCYDSGFLVRIDVDTGATTNFVAGLGHPVGLVIDATHKFAYVTEQDKASLTKIDLGTGAASVVQGGLIQPFFLAWDRDATGVFCVQRDPANSLVRVRLGTLVTAETVASGLAWRPSGVAPNADNRRIYICADQRLQVISFDGVPSIVPDPPPFDVYSIRFNFDKSQAISLKDHETDDYIHVEPEWISGSRSEPAAYVRRTLPHIKVVLRKLPGFAGGTYAVGAIGNLGGIRRKDITPTFDSSGLTDPVDFELMWPLPNSIGKHKVHFEWYSRNTAGPAVPTTIGNTEHTICTTWQNMIPRSSEQLYNWVYKEPMLWTSEWAAGKSNEKEICDAIIENLHQCNRKYGVYGYSVKDILTGEGGMCSGWYQMFQHLAHCQGVFVARRCYLVDVRLFPNEELKWRAIVIKSGGLNQPKPTRGPAEFHDVDTQYPMVSTTPINTVVDERYCFYGPGDGHCIDFLTYQGKLYLYDPSFGTGPFEIAPFAGSGAPLPEVGAVIGGVELSDFKKKYLNTAVDYMMGDLRDGSDAIRHRITVKTLIIPDVVDTTPEITFFWYN